jgi:hypothetical protein
MVTMVILAVALTAQDASLQHVRSTDRRILSLIEIGLERSETFRRLVATLNESDVFVYVEPKVIRQALGGYLAHNVVTNGGYRYLHVSVATRGSMRRVVALLAHELQHAVEVAQDPDARNPEELERLFSRLAVNFGCGSTTCYETQAAKDVEHAVSEEFRSSSSPRRAKPRGVGLNTALDDGVRLPEECEG